MTTPWRALREAGILGINQRNLDVIIPENDRRLYPLVDDKLQTKRMCIEAGIPVPRLVAVAEHHFETSALVEAVLEMDSFALKPSRGAGGNGIVVVRRREGDNFVRAGGDVISGADLRYHASGIIAGLYSLGGGLDAAMVEEALVVHPTLRTISSDGVPDLRVIVFRGVPVMAMMRLPTHQSRGRANLHQGAMGVGIDLRTGRTSHAVLAGRPATHHPDSDEPVVDVELPDFDTTLRIATNAASRTGLGYVGADVVVDKNRGAVILELNARPGLQIQIANRMGLLGRIQRVEAEDPSTMSFDERVALGRSL